MEQPTKRRDRWTRGKLKDSKYERVAAVAPLTPRDEKVLLTLLRYPLLRGNWLWAFGPGGKNETYFKYRLRYLFDIGFVDRPSQGTRNFHALYQPLIYRLSEKGLAYLVARGLADKRKLENISQFAHQLATCEIIADVELALKGQTSLRFIPKEELLARAPQKTRESKYPFSIPVVIRYDGEREDTHYVADGWFGIEYTEGTKKSVRWFALEINHGSNVRANNLKDASHLKKILSLKALRDSNTFIDHFGIKAPVIALFVQSEQSVTENSMGLLKELIGKSRLFAFKTIPAFYALGHTAHPDAKTLTVPWERVGHEPFRMFEA